MAVFIKGLLAALIVVQLAAVAGCVVGCYNPSVRDCAVQCSSVTDCTGGQHCSDGWCALPGHGTCDDPLASDGSTDVQPGDSPAVARCKLGCKKGTCDAAGVCVIDCSVSDSCDATDVQCAPNIPCRVVCGDRACSHLVVCGTATSCEVQCTGASSCGDEIRCGSGPCDVTCSGTSSCRRRARCSLSCACDVSCTGALSCAQTAECPMATTCQLGSGCSSTRPGCDTCSS